ncbi:hypothetical protein [Rhodopseudomonas sp. RCAM05734]|uniref:hypothetical protein n=1 Tax=Rhodopseudomonas sp. RCAM05734 TaxID=3457549 RepID=UPI00404482ED
MATMILDTVLERPARPFTAEAAGVYTIHAVRNDQAIVTHRIIPDVAVAQARTLKAAGWRVSISTAAGRQYAPSEFDQLLSFDLI